VCVTVAVLVPVGSAAGVSRAGGPITRCTAMQVRSGLVSFVTAFNAGDYRRLNALFAGSPWFRWYSSSAPGERFDPQAQKRNTLIAYFRGRHEQQDRLRLVSFKFNGNALGYGNLVWKMQRSASDYNDGAWFTVEAKGATLCEGASAKFTLMSVGAPES
jgi:hypothetical protein